jgi:DNA-binding transcriptional MerR regulator
MYSIGEFSQITGLSIKTLRFYHERGLLAPTCVDDQTGYRYYDAAKIDRARVIAELRKLEFSLDDIAAIVRDHDDESDIVEYLRRHSREIAVRVQAQKQILSVLQTIIRHQEEIRHIMQTSHFEVTEKSLPAVLLACRRMRGKYSDCGPAFGQLCRKVGWHMVGKPMMLLYDSEYKEDDADFAVCAPVRKAIRAADIEMIELPTARALTLLHQGPYAELGRSYAVLLAEFQRLGVTPALPSREVYHKGPGMIFRGNPQRYLTEIQMAIGEAEAKP